ncbi:MAG: hypothetical protein NVSMB64_14370 [Candidatus Velthaea sp.]
MSVCDGAATCEDMAGRRAKTDNAAARAKSGLVVSGFPAGIEAFLDRAAGLDVGTAAFGAKLVAAIDSPTWDSSRPLAFVYVAIYRFAIDDTIALKKSRTENLNSEYRRDICSHELSRK